MILDDTVNRLIELCSFNKSISVYVANVNRIDVGNAVGKLCRFNSRNYIIDDFLSTRFKQIKSITLIQSFKKIESIFVGSTVER